MSKVVIKLLWKVCTIEEYQPGALVSTGRGRSDFDFLYVLKGSIVFKLDTVEFRGAEDRRVKSVFVDFD